MKKQRNNGRLRRWTAFLLTFAFLVGTISVPMKVYANPYTGGNSNCTHTAWRLAYENTGIQLPGWRNACTWYDSARNAGYTVSTVPREKSIAVWSGGPSGAGHVAYVSQVSGDQIYIKEGGYSGGYHEGWENAYGRTKYYSNNYLTMIGYIYLGNTTPTIQSGFLNEGQSFNALIIRTDGWKHITVNGDNVELSSENKALAKQTWHFEQQSDGSYIITSLYDGRALDVAGAGTSNGTNVGLCTKWGTDNGAQKWFIYGNQNARRLVPKNAPDKCLDCATGSAASGTNLQIYQWNKSAAQVFSIYKTNKKVPESIKCSTSNYSIMLGSRVHKAFSVDIEPWDSDFQDLIYSVEDSSVAVVDGGIIKGVAPGTTTVTICSAYNDRLKCTITVNVLACRAPSVQAEIREIKEDSIVMYVEAEDEQELTSISFQTGELYNPETKIFYDMTGLDVVDYTSKLINNQSFTGEIEIPAHLERAAGDEHVVIVEAHNDMNYTKIVVPYSYPSGVQIPMKIGETIDEQTLFERAGKSNLDSWNRFCFETADCVSYTKGSKQEGAENYRNGFYTMNRAGRYSVAYDKKNAQGLSWERQAFTFVVACSHSNIQTQGAKEKTCTTDGYTGDLVCSDCHEVIEQGSVLPADGHVWDDFQTVREADCVHEGEKQHSCENCRETETETIAALGHVVVEDEAVPATTTSTGLTKGSHCGVCGEILEEQETIPKLTSPQPPSTTCSHPNVQTEEAKEKTCTTNGYTGDLVCSDCREVIEPGSVLPAEGHVWGDFQTVKKADCIHKGERRRTCENCGKTETEMIAALGHVLAEDKAVPATTTSAGLTAGSHCSVCGKVLKVRKTVPKLSTSQSVKKSNNSGQSGDTLRKIAKGQTYQSGKLYYMVLSVTNPTVAVTKPVKKTEKNIKIPDTVSINGVTCGVSEIAANTFKNNKKLQKVTIGKNVTKIGKKAFAGCRNLKKINIKSTKLTTAYASSIKGIVKTAVIDVPKQKIKVYKILFGIKKKSMIKVK